MYVLNPHYKYGTSGGPTASQSVLVTPQQVQKAKLTCPTGYDLKCQSGPVGISCTCEKCPAGEFCSYAKPTISESDGFLATTTFESASPTGEGRQAGASGYGVAQGGAQTAYANPHQPGHRDSNPVEWVLGGKPVAVMSTGYHLAPQLPEGMEMSSAFRLWERRRAARRAQRTGRR